MPMPLRRHEFLFDLYHSLSTDLPNHQSRDSSEQIQWILFSIMENAALGVVGALAPTLMAELDSHAASNFRLNIFYLGKLSRCVCW